MKNYYHSLKLNVKDYLRSILKNQNIRNFVKTTQKAIIET